MTLPSPCANAAASQHEMNIYAIYPKPNLSKRYHVQYVRPYLLRKPEIVKPNQVWGVDITYIPLGHSFVYLFVIIDWYSRYIVDYKLSSTPDKGFKKFRLPGSMAGFVFYPANGNKYKTYSLFADL